MANGPDMELKIIEAAIACTEKYGWREVTVRRIAEQAGVNVSAINYYFRSKEQLMERVLQITLDNAFDWTDFADSDGFAPRERLAAILEHLTAGAQAYPEITRSHFIAPLLERNNQSAAFLKLNEFMERLHDDLAARGMAPGPALRRAVVQAVSATILGIGLMHDLFGRFAAQDLSDPEVRREYIREVVDRAL